MEVVTSALVKLVHAVGEASWFQGKSQVLGKDISVCILELTVTEQTCRVQNRAAESGSAGQEWEWVFPSSAVVVGVG